jgi:hypothetical protein
MAGSNPVMTTGVLSALVRLMRKVGQTGELPGYRYTRHVRECRVTVDPAFSLCVLAPGERRIRAARRARRAA